MKINYKILTWLFVLVIAFTGCKKNNPVSTNNNNNLTIQVQGQEDGQGNYIFSINPNTGINLKAVLASVAAQNYKQTIDVNKQFQAGIFQPCLQYPVDFIQEGMQFSFQFAGTTLNGNLNFGATANYTITNTVNGGGNNSVTIQIQGQADGQGNFIISVNPNADINIVSVTASSTVQNYQQTIDVNKQFQAGTFQPCLQYPVDFIQTGMQLNFQFTGTVVNSNQEFNSASNYTVP